MWPPKSFIAVIALVFLAYLFLPDYFNEREHFEASYTPDKTYKLTFLYSDDLKTCRSAVHKNELRQARYLLTKSIRSEVEDQGGYVLNLSGGDLYSLREPSDASVFYSTDYDAMAVGSYLFDYPLERIQQQQQVSPFPFLSVNIYESETGKPAFDAHTTFNFDGLNVTVIGITSEGLFEQQRKNISSIDVSNPIRNLRRLISTLHHYSDITVVLSQSGFSDVNREAVQRADIQGLDLILGRENSKNVGHDTLSALRTCNDQVIQINLEFRNGKIIKKERKNIPVEPRVPYSSSMLPIQA